MAQRIYLRDSSDATSGCDKRTSLFITCVNFVSAPRKFADFRWGCPRRYSTGEKGGGGAERGGEERAISSSHGMAY